MFCDLKMFIINRCVHTRTLGGDDEKPARHGNKGPLLILSFFIVIDDGRTPKARIAEIDNF